MASRCSMQLHLRVVSVIILCLLNSMASHAWADDTYPRSRNSIGVNYGEVANNLPPVQKVVALVRSTTIAKIRLYDANPAILRAFANTNIQLTVGIAIADIPDLANPTFARSWVDANILPYLPATLITGISVGNEFLTSSSDPTVLSQLLPAMESLQSALVSSNLQVQIKITAPQSLAILSASFPPSAGAFDPALAQAFIKPLLTFLSSTNSSFMVNAYPYFAYRSNPRNISLAYALFLPNPGVYDNNTGILYSNLLSAQIDAVYSAMAKLNVTNVDAGVSETGWPSVGDPDEVGVNVQNAMTYNENLIYYVVANPGTPLHPRRKIDTFIFSLFNENLKSGPTSERNFGLFQPDGTAVYEVQELRSDQSLSNSSSSTPAANASSSTPSNSSSGGGVGSSGGYGADNQIWCVAKPGTDRSLLAAAITFACGEADCAPIQPGGSCFLPNELVSHASYAFNSYYQRHGRNYWNCDFAGNSIITFSDPSYSGCIYPAA